MADRNQIVASMLIIAMTAFALLIASVSSQQPVAVCKCSCESDHAECTVVKSAQTSMQYFPILGWHVGMMTTIVTLSTDFSHPAGISERQRDSQCTCWLDRPSPNAELRLAYSNAPVGIAGRSTITNIPVSGDPDAHARSAPIPTDTGPPQSLLCTFRI